LWRQKPLQCATVVGNIGLALLEGEYSKDAGKRCRKANGKGMIKPRQILITSAWRVAAWGAHVTST